jgi:hypothetical protein
MDALGHMGYFSSFAGNAKLYDEVARGKCTLLLNDAGELERVASVVALQLEDERGDIFFQVGKHEHVLDAVAVPMCQLPGGKQDRGELPGDALQRILDTKLKPLKKCVRLAGIDRQVNTSESKDYKVRTKYLRTIYSAKFTDCLEALRIKSNAHEYWDVPASPSSHRASKCSLTESADLMGPVGTRKKRMSTTSTGSWDGDKTGTKTRKGKRQIPFSAFAEKDVFVFSESDKACFYAWLPSNHVDFLKSSAGEPVLQKWLASLDFDPAALTEFHTTDAEPSFFV